MKVRAAKIAAFCSLLSYRSKFWGQGDEGPPGRQFFLYPADLILELNTALSEDHDKFPCLKATPFSIACAPMIKTCLKLKHIFSDIFKLRYSRNIQLVSIGSLNI